MVDVSRIVQKKNVERTAILRSVAIKQVGDMRYQQTID